MTKTVHGVMHGKTIELDEDLGVAEGQEVEVQVRVVPSTTMWGEGLRRCAGALANEWTEEDDRILNEIYLDRKRDTRKEIPE
jgi:hypothetical protein